MVAASTGSVALALARSNFSGFAILSLAPARRSAELDDVVVVLVRYLGASVRVIVSRLPSVTALRDPGGFHQLRHASPGYR